MAANIGANAAAAVSLAVDDHHFPAADPTSDQDRKGETVQALKSEVMATLNEVVKSLDEDSWMFDGPRSRIHLISRPGSFLQKRQELTKKQTLAPSK
ncbi:unnamed protein product [Cuscuta campestris]|uniref:Uncharacterized protein n=2 Tax=Cuscuta sect. Cleistogrammica TaxID=1824901 RepID=A0A484KKT5_9ASTE|nr:hypothetical protein DM860_015800 [Cuscuta australis]VFQ63777.1 unnamed protein product [Cuscuta campestris]